MRLATFDVENMFYRAKAMNLDTWAEGKRLNEMIQELVYSDEIKSELLEIMKRHNGFLSSKKESKFILLRNIRGEFLIKRKNKRFQIAANGRGNWIGWFELATEPVKPTST